MTNQEHLEILKLGIDTWNRWRIEHPKIKPDFSGVNMSGAKLSYINFDNAILIRANLSETDLSVANLSNSNLIGATLSGANVSRANINYSDLSYSILSFIILDRSNLSHSNLSETDFGHANFNQTILRNTNLFRANLVGAYLGHADLTDTNLSYAVFGRTHFDDIDIRRVKGLETTIHTSSSTIGIDTIYRSEGKIPEEFLRKAGVPNHFIMYMHSLVAHPIEYYTCFISYSSKDQEFADRLYADLQSKGVRCWFAQEDMKIGDKIRPRLDESIRMYDKLLLILSEHYVESNWVEYEVETALSKETEGKPTVLFPICLDDTVMESSTAWAAHIKNTRHIGDFTKWKEHDAYQKAFTRLLRDLKAENV